MKYILLLLCLSALVSCKNAKHNAVQSDLFNQVDSIIKKTDFNGVVLVARDTTIIYSKAKGLADFESKQLLSVNDQFVIGSISKQITAVLILREYENGRLNLNDTIGMYLSDVNQAWASEVTIHHLLTHTHGITDLDKPAHFDAGAAFSYSQLGYDILAKVLECVTNQPFERLSADLFAQYGLSNTFHPDNKIYGSLVKGYEVTEQKRRKYCENSFENCAAAGSFISNVEDLNKWNALLHKNVLVSDTVLHLMTTKYATRAHPIFGEIEYGYGLLFKDGQQNIEIGALGYAPGFVSACYYYPQADLSLVVLENTARDFPSFAKTFDVHTEIMNFLEKVSVESIEVD